MISSVSATQASGLPSGVSGSKATQSQFLQLLVAQLRYQDPMSPVSGTQMMGQLMQMQTLDALLTIEQELKGATVTTSAASSSTATSAKTAASSATTKG